MKKIDFLIIGAQKSGTTSLFKYLSKHPSIFIPQEKELPFFSYDELYEDGLKNFLNKYFPDGINKKRICGTVTPQYMYDPLAPERIQRELHGVKLIAILRDPIQRAISHYKMTVRRGDERRTVDAAFQACLNVNAANDARVLRGRSKDEISCYLAWGEYGRILGGYFELFPAAQILCLDHAELESSPEIVVRKVFNFLAVDNDFLPGNLGERFHVGGSTVRTRLHERVKQIRLIRWMWRNLSCGMQYRIASFYERLNTVAGKSESTTKPSELTMGLLKKYFERDQEYLNQLKSKFPTSFFSVTSEKFKGE